MTWSFHLYFKTTKNSKNMVLITTCILILAYMIVGKDITGLLEKVKDVDWRGKIDALMDKLRPWSSF